VCISSSMATQSVAKPMLEQYIITGTVTPTDGTERSDVRVQAFDHDLSSLEHRIGLAPQLLGEVIANAKGDFKITCA
jgi:hypothetical protein